MTVIDGMIDGMIDAGGSLADRIAQRFDDGGSGLMHEFGLAIVTAEPGRVSFTLPVVPRLTHGGGVLCGQAIMACMDTGMVFVMMSLSDDPDARFTTVQLQTSFERGVPADVGEVRFEATATKTGRSLVFGQIDLLLPDERRAATATTTYMWVPGSA
ncbi:MAG: PaaI family thioesterase [Ilumatobacteraceae bacterium]